MWRTQLSQTKKPQVKPWGQPRWAFVTYFSELLTELNIVFRLLPRPLTAARIAIEIPAAIRPYSIAVAPDSFEKNFAIADFKLTSTGGCERARSNNYSSSSKELVTEVFRLLAVVRFFISGRFQPDARDERRFVCKECDAGCPEFDPLPPTKMTPCYDRPASQDLSPRFETRQSSQQLACICEMLPEKVC